MAPLLKKQGVSPVHMCMVYMNDHLINLWNTLCEKEKQYVQFKNNQWRKLRHEFQEVQKIFDQNYRKTEWNYNFFLLK